MVIGAIEIDDGATRRGTQAGTGANAAAFTSWRAFVEAFNAETRFDDPGQLPARFGGLNWMRVPMPGQAPLTLYRTATGAAIGAFLRYRDAEGFAAFAVLEADRDAIAEEFLSDGLPTPVWDESEDERTITIRAPSQLPWDEEQERAQRLWLARAANRFVNSFRPRLLRLAA